MSAKWAPNPVAGAAHRSRGAALTRGLLLAAALALGGCASQPQPPAAVTNVTATPVAAGVLVEWQGGDGASSFRVLRSDDGGVPAAVGTAAGAARAHADYTTEPGGAYVYAVVAVGAGGQADPVEQQPSAPVSPLPGVRLSIVFDGDGAVAVDGAAAPVGCEEDCTVGFAPGSTATLTGEGVDGSAFAGLSSPCPPSSACEVVLDEDRELTAYFRGDVLRVFAQGSAEATVAVSPPDDRGIGSCTVTLAQDCLLGYTYTAGGALKVSVNVTIDDPTAEFVGFDGACTAPSGPFCLVDVDGLTSVAVGAGYVPAAVADEYRAPRGAPLTIAAPGVLANDDSPDPATVAVLTGPPTGTLDLAADGGFTYTSASDASGVVEFTYAATTELGLESGPATVALTIVPPPVANPDGYALVEDQALSVAAPAGLLANDTYTGEATAEVVDLPASGTLELGADGSFTYTPAPDTNGDVTFTYRAVAELGLASEPATVTLAIAAVNDPPTFTIPSTEVVLATTGGFSFPGFATAIGAGAPDESGQTLSFVVQRAPPSGQPFFSSVAISADGTLYGVHLIGAGVATFDVYLSDDGGTLNGGVNVSPTLQFTISAPG